eukprot:TRINITY_DN4145_c0_g1_i1.p1 TRINITY_DN4145_c0_g1~~TRINITY_DN4145_c0_g1_i1.p1  ORF type:complete len:499 (+),score=91.40 TRINITY_DN4145_c0_g1_i1:1012-2508(+)
MGPLETKDLNFEGGLQLCLFSGSRTLLLLFLKILFTVFEDQPISTQFISARWLIWLYLSGLRFEESKVLVRWLLSMGFSCLGLCGISQGGNLALTVGSLLEYPMAISLMIPVYSATDVMLDDLNSWSIDWKALLSSSKSKVETAEEKKCDGTEKMTVKDAALKTEGSALENEVGDTDEKKPETSGITKEEIDRVRAQLKLFFDRYTIDRIDTALLRQLDNPEYKQHMKESNEGESDEEGFEERFSRLMTSDGQLDAPEDDMDSEERKNLKPHYVIQISATNDKFVPHHSSLSVTQHVRPDKVSWITGGHVSAFVLHMQTFVNAVAESFDGLKEKYSLANLSYSYSPSSSTCMSPTSTFVSSTTSSTSSDLPLFASSASIPVPSCTLSPSSSLPSPSSLPASAFSPASNSSSSSLSSSASGGFLSSLSPRSLSFSLSSLVSSSPSPQPTPLSASTPVSPASFSSFFSTFSLFSFYYPTATPAPVHSPSAHHVLPDTLVS